VNLDEHCAAASLWFAGGCRWNFVQGESGLQANRASARHAASSKLYRRKLQKRLMHHKQQLLDLQQAKKHFLTAQVWYIANNHCSLCEYVWERLYDYTSGICIKSSVCDESYYLTTTGGSCLGSCCWGRLDLDGREWGGSVWEDSEMEIWNGSSEDEYKEQEWCSLVIRLVQWKRKANGPALCKNGDAVY